MQNNAVKLEMISEENNSLDSSVSRLIDSYSLAPGSSSPTPSAHSTAEVIYSPRRIASETATPDKQSMQNSLEAANSDLQELSNQFQKDKFASFGEYVSSSLRVLPKQYGERLMAKIKLEIGQTGLDAANYELRRLRILPQNAILLLNSYGEQYVEYYAFGEDDTPYNPLVHKSIYILDGDANVVCDSTIISKITASFKNNETSDAITIIKPNSSVYDPFLNNSKRNLN